MRLTILAFVLALSGCLSFGSGPGVTTVEREKTACAEEGGVWTQSGCVIELKLGVSV